MDPRNPFDLVADVARAFAQSSGDMDIASESLTSPNVPGSVALLRIELLATAFGWGLLRQMGVTKFPSTFIVADAFDREHEVQVADSTFFAAALSVAGRVFEKGYDDFYTQPLIELFCRESAEFDAVNRALSAEPETELSQAQIGPTRFAGHSVQDFDSA